VPSTDLTDWLKDPGDRDPSPSTPRPTVPADDAVALLALFSRALRVDSSKFDDRYYVKARMTGLDREDSILPDMVDPAVALPSFQEALNNGELAVQRCKTDPSLLIAMDEIGNGVRLTYFRMEGAEVTGICMVVNNGFHNGSVCFDLGYAVVEKFRQQGRGTELVGAAVKDHIAGMARAGVTKLYVEAVIGVNNAASQRIAERHLGEGREEIIDNVSGLPAYRYALGVGLDV
jgi:hypothetical protein